MSRVMKQYVFEVVLEKKEQVVVEAEDYEEAEDLFVQGDYDDENITTIDIHFTDWKCIKMPENLEEEK
tara:strand:- start:43 stop:246 length:204 start_codon:yes stop_codon:yes gene_type:complete